MSQKQKVLFICSHNAARSQLAEGLMRYLFGDRYEVHSAGTSPLGVHPAVYKVLGEMGVDVSGQRSKSIRKYKDWDFDFVVTLCDGARARCPFFPGKEVIHHPFRDPVITRDPDEDIITAFRKVRDDIKAWLDDNFA